MVWVIRAAWASIFVLASACYAPAIGDGAFACGANGLCPQGFHCLSDGLCHRSGDVDVDASVPDLLTPDDLTPPPQLDFSLDDLTQPPDLALPLAAPLAFWKLDENGGTVAADAEGLFPGTVENGTFVAGKHGNAISCNGTTTDVSIGNPAGLQLTGAMSVAAWVNIASYATAGRVLSKGGGVGMRGWSLNVEANGIARFMIASDTNTNITADGAVGAIATGTWAHLAGVYEPGVAVRFYVNGALVASTTAGVPATQFNSTLPVYICRRDDGEFFSGIVDEVRIYDFALSATQVMDVAR